MENNNTPEKETGGFTPPISIRAARTWENPPASKEVKERLRQGIMELYYDICNEFDKLARANQPMPQEIHIASDIDLTELGTIKKKVTPLNIRFEKY